MANTELSDVSGAIQEFWSPLFMDALREQNILFNLINKEYSGDLLDTGDTVKVQSINNLVGQTLTINQTGGARTFVPEAMQTTTVNVTADRRFVASIDFADLLTVQSLVNPLGSKSVEVRNLMAQAVSRQLNTYLYSLLAPTVTTVVPTMSATELARLNKYAAQEYWDETKGWWGLVGPSYYEDLLLDTTITNNQYGSQDAPTIAGQLAQERFGFNILRDNSTGNADRGLFFHPDFMYLVTQYEPRFMVSSKHSSHEFAYVMSVDMVAGAAIGVEGAVKHTLDTLV